ncbi:hypothetical protein SAMN02910369_02742 [Lachnospiraceae bacterium NE2001]|nr:hypothetical protein SAMN02910369_02742 [Lachnospiraceae bacterium NE2001]
MEKELVISDINLFVETCDGDMKEFNTFKSRYEAASDVVDRVNEKIQELQAKWIPVKEYVSTNGMDEEGDYSYAKLALNISLAYKKLSEIVNELRFGLEFLELVDEYKEFEMEYRLKNKK